MIANYHTHTVRCRHASGSEEEYIRAAIEAGLKILGFADHAPQPFRGGYYSRMRMHPHQLTEYVHTLRELQAKFAGELEIHIGLETEYYPELFPELLRWVRAEGVEYMILGQHWLGNEQGERHIYQPFSEVEQLTRYVDQTIEAMQTGAFTYFAHPDLPTFEGNMRIYDEQMRRMIRQANACGVPLEINIHGIRNDCRYPHEHFWALAAEENAQVVMGRDAHQPEELMDAEVLAQAENFAARLGLQVLQKVNLVKP